MRHADRIWSWRNLGCLSQVLDEEGLFEDGASMSRSVFLARLDAILTSAAATCAILSSHA